MRRLICAGLGAAALVAVPAAADEVDRQVAAVEGLAEIEELAVIKLSRDAEDEAEGPEAAGGDQDPLMAGAGERDILTAEDTDELPPGMADEEPEAEAPEREARPEASSGALDEGGRESLAEAIEGNEVLSDALESRGVAAASVVAVDVRGGAVIVYVDEG